MQNNTYKIVTQHKTREQAENQKQKNILKQKANKTKQKTRTRNWNERQIFIFNKPQTLELQGKPWFS